MRIRRTLSPLLGLSLTLAGCAAETDEARTEAERPGTIAAPAADPAAVRRIIDSTNVLLADAIHKEDAAAHSAMYTSDAIVMMQNTPAAKGSDAIRQHIAGMYGAVDVKDAKFTTEDLEVIGDVAIETGSYSMTVTPTGAKPMQDKGKYLTVWKRQADGSWKIHRDISNTDLEPK